MWSRRARRDPRAREAGAAPRRCSVRPAESSWRSPTNSMSLKKVSFPGSRTRLTPVSRSQIRITPSLGSLQPPGRDPTARAPGIDPPTSDRPRAANSWGRDLARPVCGPRYRFPLRLRDRSEGDEPFWSDPLSLRRAAGDCSGEETPIVPSPSFSIRRYCSSCSTASLATCPLSSVRPRVSSALRGNGGIIPFQRCCDPSPTSDSVSALTT